ncbi:MAG: hypothetical protein R3C56_30625 [Pirellulaceae bacterium]
MLESTDSTIKPARSWSIRASSSRSARICPRQEEEIDLQGRLVVPPYVDPHIDVDDPKLTGLKAMLEIREELKDNVTIQIVAFPQEGMYAYKGGDEMVEE